MQCEEPMSTQCEEPMYTQRDKLTGEAVRAVEDLNVGVSAAGEETPTHSQDYVEKNAPNDGGSLD